MFEDKPCDVSLGLEPSLRAGSFYVCGIIKIGRNTVAFLGNTVGRRRMRTAWGSVYDTIKVGRDARAFLGNAADKRRMRTAWGSVYVYCFVSLAFG